MLNEVKRPLMLAKLLTICMICIFSSTGFAQTQKKKKGNDRKGKSKAAGAAVGGNTATPVDLISAAEGFQVELLY